MIVSFRHRGLKRLYEKGDGRRLRSDLVAKIECILARLDEAGEVGAMDLPGLSLHPLKEDLAGLWAVTVRANWRIIFRFKEGHAYDVDLTDYH
jgi:proteic killer suppression protein